MTIVEMKQKRANLVTNMRELMDQHKDSVMPAEKEAEYTRMEADFDKLNKQIMTEEAQLERERQIGEAQNAQRQDAQGPGDPIRTAFTSFIRMCDGQTAGAYHNLAQDNPSQAGYLVAPQQFVADVIQAKNDLTFMRQLSNVLPPMEKAQSLGCPKRTSRMNTFAWGTEIKAPTPDSALAFGKREFVPKPATGGILVSKTLMRNAAINADAYLRGEMAYDYATHEEEGYMTGTGAGQPLGVFTANADGISTSRDVSTGNTATDIKFDGLMEAKYSIKEQYHAGLNWIFHRDGVKKIAKLKDSDGQYVWQPSVAAGVPDRLLSFFVRMSEYAPNTFTTGKYVGILGDFKTGYWICDSLMMEINVLVELYALTNQVFYIGRAETDGMPVLDECFARVKLG